MGRFLGRPVRGRLIVSAAGLGLLALSGCQTLLEPLPASPPVVSRGERSPCGPGEEILAVEGREVDPPMAKKPEGVQIPAALPGAEAVLPNLPPDTPATRPARDEAIDKLFPPLPPLGEEPVPALSDSGLSLNALIDQARQNSPVIQQAIAEIERNRGQWVQAGLYPNPTIGFQADQIADFGPYGQFGGYVSQNIVTGGKLRIARGVAWYDLLNARLRLRWQEVELARQVRNDYYAVIIATESLRITRLICELADSLYAQQLAALRVGQTTAHDASAARALAGQARISHRQAQNRAQAAWRQLAATINNPEMTPTPLAGRIDAAIPRFRYDALQARLLAEHTNLSIARNELAQAQETVLLEQRRVIPDVQNYFYLQRDTLAASQNAPSVQVGMQIGVTVPVFNRNQGAISAATATVVDKTRNVETVRNQLLRTLAECYERYENGRQQVALYRDVILPNLARAFRGTAARYQVEPDKVSYWDIVNAYLNFAGQMGNYLQALQTQWQAVADVTAAVQGDDPYQLADDLEAGADLGVLDQLPPPKSP